MRKHLPLLAICLGYFMVILDATIVNVALPALGRELGGGVSGLQWILDAYTVVFAGLLLPAGSLGDRVGARRVFALGLGVFTLASAACGAAPTVAVLIAARALQGLGAALLVPSSLALLRGVYRSRHERARALGVWGAVAGTGAASGPILGGALVGLIGWRAVFLVNVPVGSMGLMLAARYLPVSGERTEGGFDPPGQALGVLSLTLLTLGVIEGGSAGWSAVQTLTPIAAAVVALALFVVRERRARHPMLPLSLFASRTFSAASFVGLAINLGFYGQLFAISLLFQHARGYSAPSDRVGDAARGRVRCDRVCNVRSRDGTPRPAGPDARRAVLGAAGFLGLLSAGSSSGYAVLIAPLVAAGFGMALTMPAATAAVIEAAPADRAGIASGVLNAARQAGGALGVALLGTLIAGHLVSGFHTAMFVSAGAFLAGAVATLVAVEQVAEAVTA